MSRPKISGSLYLILFALAVQVGGCYFLRDDKPSSREDFDRMIASVDCDDSDRLVRTKELFEQLGANQENLSVETLGGVYNVVVTVPGRSSETIVVGAHYDKTTLGCGAIDNWTGVVIIANLFKAMKNSRSEKTIKFVAFGKEERGLLGSRAMVNAIPESDRSNNCAMVNFDSFGFESVWALRAISDESMIKLAREVSNSRSASFVVKDFKGASSDSKSFREAGIPAITFSGLGNDWRNYLHQKSDQLDNVNNQKVYDNYLFAIDYVKAIDSRPCASFR